MEEIKKRRTRKYFALFVLISLVAASIFFVAKNHEEVFSIFKNGGESNPDQTSQVQTEGPTCSDGILNQDETKADCGGTICPACPTCTDGIQNQGERHADCGGPCTACPPDCSDGILNQDETKADCGGTICPACPTCTDGIQNQGERHADCGGPCTACPPDCSDGIQNQGEAGVDCGGPCSACPTCTDGIQNQGEAGVDCGGPCSACPIITALTADELAKVKNAILSSEFVSALPKDGVIALHFFNYQYGQRVELDTLLIGKDQILTSGTPDITILLNSKYIAELTPTNLCEIIPRANTNGDLGVETTLGETKLLMKYSGIIKYRDCFGF